MIILEVHIASKVKGNDVGGTIKHVFFSGAPSGARKTHKTIHYNFVSPEYRKRITVYFAARRAAKFLGTQKLMVAEKV